MSLRDQLSCCKNNPFITLWVLLIISFGVVTTVGAFTPPSQTRMGKPPGGGNSGDNSGGNSKQPSRKNTTANAKNLLEQAKNTTNPQRKVQLKLRAARTLLLAKLVADAKTILTAIDPKTLSGNLLINYRLEMAHVAVSENKPRIALQYATGLTTSAPTHFRIESHRLRSLAYQQLGNKLQAIQELLQLESLTQNPNTLIQIRKALWAVIQQYPLDGLKQLVQQSQTSRMKGWFELALIYKLSRFSAQQLSQKLTSWRAKYSSHSAVNSVLPEILKEQKAIASRPTRLALLLPLKGRFGRTARAIRDGFVAAHFSSSNDRKKIVIRIYDTSSNNIAAIYQKVVADGAQIIIGPLKKSNVRKMSEIKNITIPVLALNFLAQTDNKTQLPPMVTYFGLSPEDEARQIAERAIFENKTRALILVPNSRWGGRIIRAFTKRFKELGGTVMEVGNYNSSKFDHRKPLLKLLNLDESYSRYRSIAIRLNRKVKFEPRRRKDVDFIFVAAFPKQARLIAPQLKFFRATGLPVYTTSHAYSGVVDPRRDNDMNRVVFCDMPWSLTLYTAPTPIQKAIKQHYSARLRGLSRLYALGVDAYNIIPYLKWLKQQSHQRYQGQTGLLSIDKNNRIRRILKWAVFKQGKAVILQK